MRLPEISVDGKFTRVDIGPLVVWYSYATMVAFSVIGQGKVVSENRWGVQTGKHLNAIDGGEKSKRVNQEQFEKKWFEVNEALNHMAATNIFGICKPY